MDELKDIALELLEKYYDAEIGVIYEYSGNIIKSEQKLDQEYNEYKNKIRRCLEG